MPFDAKITLPLSIIKWLYHFILRITIKWAYEKSHNFYLSELILGRRWSQIGYSDFYESHFFASTMSNDAVPQSKLAIKSNNTYKSFTVRCKAWHERAEFEDVFFVRDFSKPRIFTLCQIPLQDLEWVDGGKVRVSYSQFRIMIEDIVGEDGSSEKDIRSLSWMVGHNDFLNTRWDKKWDAVWNLWCLDQAQRHFMESFKYSITGMFFPKILYARGREPQEGRLLRRLKNIFYHCSLLIWKAIDRLKLPIGLFWVFISFRLLDFDDRGGFRFKLFKNYSPNSAASCP